MGIKNLSKILKKVAPAAISEITMEDLRGKTVALDVPIFMYKFHYVDPTNPLLGFQNQIKVMKEYNIHPIYVFDGKAAPSKAPELEKRREMKRKAVDDLQAASKKLAVVQETNRGADLVANFAAIAHAQNTFQRAQKKVISVPTKKSYMDLENFFKANNIDWIQATHDAEKTAAQLVSNGTAYAVCSEDFDTLPYLCGGGHQGKFVTKFGSAIMLQYDLEQVLVGLKMDREQFVDFCILCGCDLACGKIKNVAGKRALGLIQSHKSIENIVRTIDHTKYPVPESFDYNAARVEFGIKTLV